MVRLENENGTFYGDAILPKGETDVYKAKQAKVIEGDIFNSYEITSKVEPIQKLLTPLSTEDIKSIKCVGMNYTKHAIEIKMEIPKYPVLFFKPKTALVGPSDPIVVPAGCQTPPAKIDYEVELTIVIGKKCRDILAEDAHKYILGYTICNDVSQRTWQMERGGTQFSIGKSFDTFAPLGPAVVNLKDAKGLNVATRVNGVTRQSSNTDDTIFNCFEIVAFMSIGTTLLPDDIILTGTPSGVALGLNPPPYLKEGDVVELDIEKIGILRNEITFEHRPDITQRHV